MVNVMTRRNIVIVAVSVGILLLLIILPVMLIVVRRRHTEEEDEGGDATAHEASAHPVQTYKVCLHTKREDPTLGFTRVAKRVMDELYEARGAATARGDELIFTVKSRTMPRKKEIEDQFHDVARVVDTPGAVLRGVTVSTMS